MQQCAEETSHLQYGVWAAFFLKRQILFVKEASTYKQSFLYGETVIWTEASNVELPSKGLSEMVSYYWSTQIILLFFSPILQTITYLLIASASTI